MGVDVRVLQYIAERLAERLPDPTPADLVIVGEAAMLAIDQEIDGYVTQAAIERESAEAR